MSRPSVTRNTAFSFWRIENIPGFMGLSNNRWIEESALIRVTVKFARVWRKSPVKFSRGFVEVPAKMAKRKRPQMDPEKPLDAFGPKRPRGRPGVSVSVVVARAENYRRMFWDYRLDKKKKEYVRDKPSEWAMQLLASKTVEDVERAFQSQSISIQNDFRPLFPLILKVLRERTFPKKPETQLDFLADSIAARGDVTPRRSRDICEKERAKQRQKSHYKILRHEYYIECSCGYKGPARDHACRKCGAQIGLSLEEFMGPGLF